MKKLFFTACVGAALMACNNQQSQKQSSVAVDSTTNTSMNVATGYTPNNGDATYRNDRLMVYRDSTWVNATGDQTMGNGVVVHTNGTVTNGVQTDTLTDGQIVSKSGTFFDKSGHAIRDVWTATKHGVGEAGEAVGKAAGEAGEGVGQAASKTEKATKDAVTGEKNK